MRVFLAAVLALSFAASATAQATPEPVPLASGPVADSTVTDSVAADAPVVAAEPEVTEAPPRPFQYGSAASSLTVTLPAGWDGPVSVDEGRMPAYAIYTFEGTGALRATVVVERVVGLNPLDQQRWQGGQTAYGYHGLTSVGPASAPLPGLGIELTGPGVAGVVVFVQRGQTFWAVHVQAPEAVWRSQRDAVLGLLTGVVLP